MSEHSLQITFSNSGTDTVGGCYKLEQEPWPDDVGETSNMRGILAISAAAHGGVWPSAFCAGLNGAFTTTVFVYPCLSAPPYRLGLSHGLTNSIIAEYLVRDEIVQTSMQLTQDLGYVSRGVLLKQWIGKCYDADGGETIRPAVTLDGNTLTFSKAVYASLRVRYSVLRYSHDITVTKRITASENKYQSTAFIVWDGGVEWLDIEAPSTMEAFDGDCGNGAFYDPNMQDGYDDGQLSGTSSKICSAAMKDRRTIPVGVQADKYVTMAYCYGEEIGHSHSREEIDWERPDDCG